MKTVNCSRALIVGVCEFFHSKMKIPKFIFPFRFLFSGNAFVFDFVRMSWYRHNGIAANCSCVTFEVSTTNILIGFRDGHIASVDCASGQTINEFQAFTQRLRAILLAPQRPDIILCHTNSEIMLYCRVNGALSSHNVFNVASVESNATNLSIKQVLWMRTTPITLAVLCLLSDDSIFVWENAQVTDELAAEKLIKSFTLRKHMHPLQWLEPEKERASTPDDENNNNVAVARDPEAGEIWTISVLTTQQVSQVAVCCSDRSNIIVDAIEWKLIEVIRMPKCAPKPLVIVDRTYAETVLNRTVEAVWAAINECDQLFMFEKAENIVPSIASLVVTHVKAIRISSDGKVMAALQKDGCILLLDTEFFLRQSLVHHVEPDATTLLSITTYNEQMRQTNRKVSVFRASSR